MCKKNQYTRRSTYFFRFNVEFCILVHPCSPCGSRGFEPEMPVTFTRGIAHASCDTRDSGFDVTSCRAPRPSAGQKIMNHGNPRNDSNFNIRTIQFTIGRRSTIGLHSPGCLQQTARQRAFARQCLHVLLLQSGDIACPQQETYLSLTTPISEPENRRYKMEIVSGGDL